MKCRHCKSDLRIQFLDLGNMPPSNAYLRREDLQRPEMTYPLRILTCDTCWLVQTEDYTEADELFNSDYAYFSSTSVHWLAHAKAYCTMITERLGLGSDSFVVEIASNDGYLLKNFVVAGIPCLGVEPTQSTAMAAEQVGVPTLQAFFGKALGEQLSETRGKADLILGNNVYAHVPDINDFTRGVTALLKPEGVVTFEFPHLMQLLVNSQFDTVYHEHFSYLSLYSVERVFEAAGLRVFDVEEISTHGGSLRVYGCLESAGHARADAIDTLLGTERDAGLMRRETYETFQEERVNGVRDDLWRFFLDARRDGKTIAAYGAAAKGNTLLNYAGIKPDLLPFVCDAAQMKIGKYMPASRIPIMSPDHLREHRPDYLLVLPWNILNEVMEQNRALAEQGTRFVTVIPRLVIH